MSKSFERIRREVAAHSQARREDLRIARRQWDAPEADPPRAPQKAREATRVRRARAPLESSIGFDSEEVLLRRIRESKKDEFRIDRELRLRHTRYVPFGSEDFYRDPVAFYSRPTALACLWCTEGFEGLPLALPVRFHERDGVFEVTGQFCSPSCMLAQARELHRSLELARLFLKRCYGVPVSAELQPAPDRRSLAKFGGMYSLEAFRATGATGVRTAPVRLPLVPSNAGLSEIESTTTVVSEIGGAELARQRIKQRLCMTSMTPAALHRRAPQQQGRFRSAPSIAEQIAASDNKVRLQMEQLQPQRPRNDITSFMRTKARKL